MTNVWPLTGVGAATDWSFAGTGFYNGFGPNVSIPGDGSFAPPSTGDIASLNGSALTALDAAVPDTASCTVTLYPHFLSSSAANDCGLNIRIKGGDWTAFPIPWDDGGAWTAPADVVVVAGSGSGFEVQGDGAGTGSSDTIAFNDVSVEPAAGGDTIIAVSPASLTYQGEAITVDAKTVKPVVAGAMAYAGRAVAVNAKTAKAVVAGAMHYAGAAVTVNARTARAVVAGAMAYAGAAVTVNAGKRVPVVAAAMAYAGQATRIAQRIIAGVGQIFYFGQLVSAGSAVAGAVAAGAQRLRLGGGFR